MSNYRTDRITKFAEMFKALSNPNRLAIFLQLVGCCGAGTCWPTGPEGCACVGELTDSLSLAPSTISHHVKELRQAGLIRTERDGQFIRCWIDPEVLRELAAFFSMTEAI
jgi:ArsR family transcriptional regulator